METIVAVATRAYDGAGNVKSIGSQTFVYDGVSRLTAANILANGVSKQQSAVFDPFGNITSTTTTDWGTQTFSVNVATNRLNSPVTYDSGGDVTSWGGFSYTWDALGKLQKVTGQEVNHTYLYTADGERISDRDALAGASGATTITVRGLDGQALRSFIESGTTGTGAVAWAKDYVYGGGMLLASVSSHPDEGTRYFALDHLGTPRLVTSACATTLARHDYYPFGMEATSSTQDSERMKFTGQERDLMGTYGSQTDDLDNMHARFYNPNLSRFLSPDLLRGDPHAPQSFNLFAYVSGNPMNYVDPSGLQVNGSLSYSSGELNRFDPSQTGWGTGIAGFFAGLFTGPDVGFKYWGIYGVDQYAWQHNNWAFGSNTPGGSSSGGIGGGGNLSAGSAGYSGSGSILGYIAPGDLVSWQATSTGLYAWADGFDPFGTPFADAGWYDPNFPGAGVSRFAGAVSFQVLTAALDLEIGEALGAPEINLKLESAQGRMGPHFNWGPFRPGSTHPRWHWGPRNPKFGASNFTWWTWFRGGRPWRWR
jgi:RHS repeat-associated protein